MTESMQQAKPDRGVVLFAVLAILGLSLFLQFTFGLKQAVLFLTGAGLGISLLHAVFSFSSVWRNFIRQREGAGIRAQLLLFMLALAKVWESGFAVADRHIAGDENNANYKKYHKKAKMMTSQYKKLIHKKVEHGKFTYLELANEVFSK